MGRNWKLTSMQLALHAVCLMLSFSVVSCNPFCKGTCYSGRLFPEPQDIFHGKHLKGFSYKNITTDNPRKCYSICSQDCRCKACQMKDERCELLDEDKVSKPDTFVPATGYVYYDLKQTMYHEKSHMLPVGDCHNDCCKFQTCLNGGTCIERCQSPKDKFTCKCLPGFVGKFCETITRSCLDVLKASRKFPRDGVYLIKRGDNNAEFETYCSFVYPNQAWMLIESFSLENNIFKTSHFSKDHAKKKDEPTSWSSFRVGDNRMRYIYRQSTLFRATCDFPNRNGIMTPDLLIGRLNETDIMTFMVTYPACKKYVFIDIRGHQCRECTAFTMQKVDRHFYIDITKEECQFRPAHTVESVDSFGYYDVVESVSKCTATQQSTTQWWMGNEI